MLHAKSLRVIGQSLELAKIPTFELESEGPNYVVKSDLLTAAGEWVLRHALSRYDFSEQTAPQSTMKRSVRFTPRDISRLDEQAQMQRRGSATLSEGYRRLSQLLRTLGDQFDRMHTSSVQISWMSDSASVAFQLPDGEFDSRTYTAEKLQQLGSSSRFLRSSQTGADNRLRGFAKVIKPHHS
jgi:hypothetical protein